MNKNRYFLVVTSSLVVLGAALFPGVAQAGELIVLSSASYDTGNIDVPNGVAVDSDGNIIVTGASNGKYLTVRYNKDFVPLQSQSYDGGPGGAQANGVAVDSLNNIIVTGQVVGDGSNDYFTIKYNFSLQQVYSSATFDSAGIDVPLAIAVDHEDNIVVSGYSFDGWTSENFSTIKYDKDLKSMASESYDSGRHERAAGVAIDSQNNIVVTGQRENGTNYDYYTIKYDKNLNVLASAVFDGGKDEKGAGVAIDKDDNIIVTGRQNDGVANNYCTVKYDTYLNFISSAVYDNGNEEKATGVAVDGQGNIIVTGGQNTGTYDYFTVKYDGNLRVISSATYDSGKEDYPNAIAIDPDDNIIVTGRANDGATNNYLSIKYLGSPQITGVSSLYQGETGALRISGKCLSSGATVSFEDAGLTPYSPSVISQSQMTATVAVSSWVPLGITTLTVTNSNGEFATRNDVLEVFHRRIIDPSQSQEIGSLTNLGEVTIVLSSETFVMVSTLTISTLAVMPPVATGLQPVGSGVTVTVAPADSALKDFVITLPYTDESIRGHNESRLAVAYYDDAAAQWVPLRSTIHTDRKKVAASARYINKKYALVELSPLTTQLANVRVYPNPYKPGSGTDFDNSSSGEGIVFSNLVPEFKIRIFTVAGELVFSRETTSDVYGLYLWDTRNEQGEPAASGVYLYLIEDKNDPGQRAKGKFSIIR